MLMKLALFALKLTAGAAMLYEAAFLICLMP